MRVTKKMAACGECFFMILQPVPPGVEVSEKDLAKRVGDCHRFPPVPILLPGEVASQGKVALPGNSQPAGLVRKHMYPPVNMDSIACGEFTPRED